MLALPLCRSLSRPLARPLVAGADGFSPLSLAPALWLDGLDSATILNASALPASNGEQVATWVDKSGNGRHATQAVNSIRPLRSAGGLTFDGVDDTMLISGGAMGGQVVYFAVLESATATWNSWYGVIDTSESTDIPDRWALVENGSTGFHNNGLPVAVRRNGVDFTSPFNLLTINQKMLLTIKTVNATSAVRSLMQADGGFFGGGKLSELILLTSNPAMNSAAVADCESYLKAKHGIA